MDSLPPPCPCGRHRMYPVDVVARWGHSIYTVREAAQQADLWDRAVIPRRQLRALIEQAGGVACEFALDAWILPCGGVVLQDGCHRWAVADELGLAAVPVLVEHMTSEDDLAWVRDFLDAGQP